jgi:hypothetical protein
MTDHALVPLYVAHPLSGSVMEQNLNRLNAAAWVAWLAQRYYCAPVCTWITLASVWDESKRDMGLAIDRVLVELVGTVVACGGHMSPGMRAECAWSTRVVDVTRHHCLLPGLLDKVELWWLDSEMALAGILRRASPGQDEVPQ